MRRRPPEDPVVDCPYCGRSRGEPPFSCLACRTTIPRGTRRPFTAGSTRLWGGPGLMTRQVQRANRRATSDHRRDWSQVSPPGR